MNGVEAPAPAKPSVETFEEFFDANYERLLRTLYLVCGSRDEAEDLAQDAFVRACERWDRVRAMANPVGYVYRTALNRYRSALRRIGVAMRRRPAASAADALAAADQRDELRRALAQLPEGQRAALALVEWLGMSDEEAGRILGVEPVTVRVRISRAHKALRPILEGSRDA